MQLMQHINEHIVPISRFNRGEANKIFDEVSKDGFRYVVKNNQVKCILISPEAYDKMIDEIEDYYDLKWAEDRAKDDNGTRISMREMAEKFNITEEELEAIPDVEID